MRNKPVFLFSSMDAARQYVLLGAALAEYCVALKRYNYEIVSSLAKLGPVVRLMAGIYPSGLEHEGWEDDPVPNIEI